MFRDLKEKAKVKQMNTQMKTQLNTKLDTKLNSALSISITMHCTDHGMYSKLESQRRELKNLDETGSHERPERSLTNHNEDFAVRSDAAILTPEVSDFNHFNIARQNYVKFMDMKVILKFLCIICVVSITLDRRKVIEYFILLIKHIIILSTMCFVTSCIRSQRLSTKELLFQIF
jgi:hypothetical protein